MQKQWFVFSEKFSKLSVREQYIILLAGVVVFFLLFNAFAFESAQSKSKRTSNSIAQLKSQNSKVTLESAKAQVKLANDPNKELDKKIAQYRSKLDDIDNELLSLTDELISPSKMRKALQDMLKLSPGVKLISFSAMAPEPLIKDELSTEKALPESSSKTIDLYRHTIRISLQGNYFQLRDYLKNVEQLSWSFYWHEFDYIVDEYPSATLNIEMYSLSTRKEFIGV
ncbi:hypothetical protein RGQ13_02650 [Thalassotalea psychrophila]|uniref:MSHA biogenesis protein MshJ n=1 Tax=Thalassotalea psychrophila TaxID=3065647 RepID=A0ABY9TWF2_9GAMM|nr:hypothetical protein RGQ13_02650 [Colwelliaceae bacterium SQ149]